MEVNMGHIHIKSTLHGNYLYQSRKKSIHIFFDMQNLSMQEALAYTHIHYVQ